MVGENSMTEKESQYYFTYWEKNHIIFSNLLMISNWYYYEISQRNLFSQYVNVYSALFPTRFVCTRNSYKTDSERVYGMTPPRALLYPEMSLYWRMIISHTHTQIGKPSHFINVRTVVRCTKSAAAVTYTCVEVHLDSPHYFCMYAHI